MHVRTILNKTMAGNQELESRKLKLSAHSRTVLIAVDGRRSVEELEQMFSSFGQVRQILEELLQHGLIAAPASAMPAAQASAGAGTEEPDLDLMGVRKRINELSVEAGGLRAFLFTLKLEHCYSAAALRGVMGDFHKLLTKGKGQAYADQQTEAIERALSRLEKAEARSPAAG